MGASTTPKPSSLERGFLSAEAASFAEQAFTALRDSRCELNPPLAVALSGGADSTALLLFAQKTWPGQVTALHINHGLQPAACAFEHHVREQCRRLQIPLLVRQLQLTPAHGSSLEDVARIARYQALAQMAQTCHAQSVLLAQHADDQAETFLLALSRGAGLPGLAAMPKQFERHSMCFVRPWLALSGKDLRAWIEGQKEPFIHDPMNDSLARTRSKIRHHVLPALQASFPAWRKTFARSALHIWQAQTLLAEVAASDLVTCGNPPDVRALQALSPSRQANALRLWLQQQHTQASSHQMQALQIQIQACTTRGHAIELKVGHGRVHKPRACWTLTWVDSTQEQISRFESR